MSGTGTFRKWTGPGLLIVGGIVVVAVAFLVASAPRGVSTTSRPDLLATSDRFWARLAVDGDMPSPASLEGLAMEADAVVVGTVVDIRPGLVVYAEDHPNDAREAAYNANVIVEVTDGLSGAPGPGSRVVIEIFLGIGHPFTSDLAQGLPTETSVFMLQDKALFQERMGNPDHVVEAARGLYWFMPSGLFRDIDGKVRVWPGTTRLHVTRQEGRQFDEFVRELRALLGS